MEQDLGIISNGQIKFYQYDDNMDGHTGKWHIPADKKTGKPNKPFFKIPAAAKDIFFDINAIAVVMDTAIVWYELNYGTGNQNDTTRWMQSRTMLFDAAFRYNIPQQYLHVLFNDDSWGSDDPIMVKDNRIFALEKNDGDNTCTLIGKDSSFYFAAPHQELLRFTMLSAYKEWACYFEVQDTLLKAYTPVYDVAAHTESLQPAPRYDFSSTSGADEVMFFDEFLVIHRGKALQFYSIGKETGGWRYRDERDMQLQVGLAAD